MGTTSIQPANTNQNLDPKQIISVADLAAGKTLLTNYTVALANAKSELSYWQGLETQDDTTKLEIEKWLNEIEKYEKLIEEFLKKTPINDQAWLANLIKWISDIFDIAKYILSKL